MIKKLTVLVLFLFISTNMLAQKSTDRRPPKEKWSLVTIEAKVEAIDAKNRELDLRGSLGNLVTITADESVERFDEIKVNDIITADYWTYMLAEFRNPTPEELAEPLVILEEAAKAPKDFDPAGAVGALVKAVVTIEIINRPDMLVTIKGPMGNFVTIPMQDHQLIEQLNVGEIAILTYAEALALSLEKVNPSK